MSCNKRLVICKPVQTVELTEAAAEVLNVYLTTCQVHSQFNPSECRDWVQNQFLENSGKSQEMNDGASDLIRALSCIANKTFDQVILRSNETN